jgi:hypothetical protein
MSDEKFEPTPEPSAEARVGPELTRDGPPTTSVADIFSDRKLKIPGWLKAARARSLRVLSPDEARALGGRIAADKKLLERLVAALARLPVSTLPDALSAAVLDVAGCTLKARVPEMFEGEAGSGFERALAAINRLKREMKPGRERHLWLEAVVRTGLLSSAIGPAEFPGVIRAAFGVAPKAPKASKGKPRDSGAPRLAIDEEATQLLGCLAKPPVLSAALATASIYRRRLSAVEDSLGHLEAKAATAQRECERLGAELAASAEVVRARDAEIVEHREQAKRQQAAWDAQHTNALHQIETLKGRMLGLLRGDFSLWLETARDAANVSPPRMAVITERLDRALERAAKEAEWLKSSDWT